MAGAVAAPTGEWEFARFHKITAQTVRVEPGAGHETELEGLAVAMPLPAWRGTRVWQASGSFVAASRTALRGLGPSDSKTRVPRV